MSEHRTSELEGPLDHKMLEYRMYSPRTQKARAGSDFGT